MSSFSRYTTYFLKVVTSYVFVKVTNRSSAGTKNLKEGTIIPSGVATSQGRHFASRPPNHNDLQPLLKAMHAKALVQPQVQLPTVSSNLRQGRILPCLDYINPGTGTMRGTWNAWRRSPLFQEQHSMSEPFMRTYTVPYTFRIIIIIIFLYRHGFGYLFISLCAKSTFFLKKGPFIKLGIWFMRCLPLPFHECVPGLIFTVPLVF